MSSINATFAPLFLALCINTTPYLIKLFVGFFETDTLIGWSTKFFLIVSNSVVFIFAAEANSKVSLIVR